jgi:hypothetical protein
VGDTVVSTTDDDVPVDSRRAGRSQAARGLAERSRFAATDEALLAFLADWDLAGSHRKKRR